MSLLTSVFDIKGKDLVARMYRSVFTPDNIDRILSERYKLGVPKFERLLELSSIHWHHVS
jgi:hypothetical protein